MKKLILPVLLILTLAITGCNTDQPNNTEDKTEESIQDKSQWQEYVNSRFEYSIKFPNIWSIGNKSQNNDGTTLNVENKNFDIRVYGTNYLKDISKPYSTLEKEGFSEKDIKLEGGQEAKLITGEEDGMLLYEMVYISQNIEYHFYAKVSEEYAREYENVILDIIKTFDPSLKGEEKTSTEDNIAKKIIEEKSEVVLSAIAKSDMEQLSKYVHPQKGVRFTPYTHISLENDLVFNKEEISNFINNDEKYLWGYYDGSGFEIKLTPKEYWKEFVYDKDFKNADETSYNEIIGKSMMIENQFEIYSEAIIVEYYIGGTNPEFEGLDWASLRLVFEEYNDSWYLVGIIHNQHVI